MPYIAQRAARLLTHSLALRATKYNLQRAMEQLQGEPHAQTRRFRVVPLTLVAHEGMFAVHLVPAETHAGIRERLVDLAPPIGWNVRILPAPDHHQFALHLRRARECVGMFAF